MKRSTSFALWLSFVILFSTVAGCTRILGDFQVGGGTGGSTNQPSGDAGAQTGPIVVDPPSGLYTSEMGGKATFTIVLRNKPSGNVSVGLSSSNAKEGTVSPAMVTFTPANYNAPQMVTVTGVDDTLPDGPQAYKIVTAPATSQDPSYNGFDAFDVSLTNIDDETAGITVTPTMGLVTNESGNEATFTVVLNSAPKSDVTVPIASSDPKEGTVDPAKLTFTAQNWRAPQMVTITGADDAVADGEKAYKVTVGPATSGDPSYNGVTGQDVDVTNEDNDEPGFTLKPTSGLMTNEDGSMTTFTIVLNLKPTANVTVNLSTSNMSEGTVSPAMLTFTPQNWNAPQTVTVTGVDDSAADGNQVYTIITAAATSDDPGYNNLDPPDIQAINVDNDSPGITAKPRTGLMTHENGMTATFTLVLNSKPSGNVVLNLASSAPTEGAVSPAKATFTSDNWNAPQTITITGVDDKTQDGNQPYSVHVTLDAMTADMAYAMLTGIDVSATNIDDDQAGILVQPQMGLVTTEKNAGSAAFTIVLTSRPTANVTIGLTSSNTAEGRVSPASVTFTPANYNAPQTVTVTGQNDDVADGMQTYRIVTAAAVSMDPLYSGINPPDVTLSNTDDDSPGITVTAGMNLATTEAGGTATFTIRLNSQPRQNVSIALSSSDTTEGTVSPTMVTFTAANWNAPQTITITGVDDNVADGNQPYTIVTAPSTSMDAAYNGINVLDVPVTNTDNDSAGITVMPTTGLTTTEAGGQATFTVVLNSQPLAAVNIGVSSSRTAEGTVSPSMLSFTTNNWNAPQTVTITGVDDAVADGNQPYVILLAAAASTDAKYSGLNPSDPAVTNTDNDSAGITVMPTTGLRTTEAGGQATFTIVLNSQPTANVTIGLSSNDTTEGTVSPASVTFTATNYRSPQTITVTGANDDVADGAQPYRIVTAQATSGDANYAAINPADVEVSNTDNDSAGITVMPTMGLVTTEAGGQATFTIVLNSQPTANVTIGLTSSDTTEGTVSPASVSFTMVNWRSPQTVTVTGVNDDMADGNQPYSIVSAQAVSTDMNYSVINPDNVAVSNTDNDSAGITVMPTMGLTTTEAGGQATFTIVLNSQPSGANTVTIPIRSTNTAEGTVSPASVTFTTANWNAAQTVTVTGVNDNVQDGNQPYTIITDPATSGDANYSMRDAADVSVSNTDNDSAGVTVMPTMGLTTTEAGGQATFTIVLNSQPTNTVTIGLSSNDTAEGNVSPTSVTFTTANWDSPRTITVTGVNDNVQDGDRPFKIVTAAATSGDPNYNMRDAADVDVTNTDNDSAGFTINPVTSAMMPLVTSEAGAPTGQATFTIVLTSQPSGTNTVTIPLRSSDTGEGTVSPAMVTFNTSDWDTPKTVTVTGVDDNVADGAQSYTIITDPAVSGDANYNNANPPDVFARNTDNDSAGFTVTPTMGLVTDEGGLQATFTIVLNSRPTGTNSVTVNLTSSNEAEGTVSPATHTFTNGNWNVAQTFTVTGQNDSMVDGSKMYSITITSTSGDPAYNNFPSIPTVSVTNNDNDSAGIRVAPTTCSTTPGTTSLFKISLHTQPMGPVTIQVHSNTPSEGDVTTPANGTVVLNGGNWDIGVTVTVTGQMTPNPAGTMAPYTIITDAATGNDGNYSGLNPDDVSCTNTQ